MIFKNFQFPVLLRLSTCTDVSNTANFNVIDLDIKCLLVFDNFFLHCKNFNFYRIFFYIAINFLL